MKRAGLLYCSGVNLARFKVLNARGQLPFAAPGTDPEDGFRSYSLDDAFRLRLMHDLIGGEGESAGLTGVGPDFAATAVFNSIGYFPRHPLEQIEPLDWWAGAVVFEDVDSEDNRTRWTAWFAGEMQHLPAWIVEKSKHPELADGKYQTHSAVVRVIIANATRAANFVRDQAQYLGVPEGDFGRDVMTPIDGKI